MTDTTPEPVGWLESPHGAFRRNPLHTVSTPPASLGWQIPVFTHPPAPDALREAARMAMKAIDLISFREEDCLPKETYHALCDAFDALRAALGNADA